MKAFTQRPKAKHQPSEEEERQRQEFLYKQGVETLEEAGVPFTVTPQGQCLQLREPGKPSVDFYPVASRWKTINSKNFMTGNAERFLAWYRSQTRAPGEEGIDKGEPPQRAEFNGPRPQNPQNPRPNNKPGQRKRGSRNHRKPRTGAPRVS